MPHTLDNEEKLRLFLESYIETALWSSLDEEDSPLEDNYGPEDIFEETWAEMRADCKDFLFAHPEDPEDPVTQFLMGLDEMPPIMAGHDFWLTRNGHGAGFWDGGWDRLPYSEDWGERLTDRAKPYGEVDLYVGDDGLIYS